MKIKIALICLVVLLISSPVFALDKIPGLKGFGTTEKEND